MRGCLEVRDAWLTVGGKTILRGATLRACPGTLTAIVGPNGAGKTSLLLSIAGVYRISRGEIVSPGKHFLLPSENPLFPGLYVYDYYATVLGSGLLGELSPEDAERVSYYSRLLDVEGLEWRVVDSLSSGERQRVFLAAALASDSTVLLFDEPVAHLDLKYQQRVMEILAREARQRVVVVVLHDLNLAFRYAGAVYLASSGSFTGPWTKDNMDLGLLGEAYGVDLALVNTEEGYPLFYPRG